MGNKSSDSNLEGFPFSDYNLKDEEDEIEGDFNYTNGDFINVARYQFERKKKERRIYLENLEQNYVTYSEESEKKEQDILPQYANTIIQHEDLQESKGQRSSTHKYRKSFHDNNISRGIKTVSEITALFSTLNMKIGIHNPNVLLPSIYKNSNNNVIDSINKNEFVNNLNTILKTNFQKPETLESSSFLIDSNFEIDKNCNDSLEGIQKEPNQLVIHSLRNKSQSPRHNVNMNETGNASKQKYSEIEENEMKETLVQNNQKYKIVKLNKNKREMLHSVTSGSGGIQKQTKLQPKQKKKHFHPPLPRTSLKNINRKISEKTPKIQNPTNSYRQKSISCGNKFQKKNQPKGQRPIQQKGFLNISTEKRELIRQKELNTISQKQPFSYENTYKYPKNNRNSQEQKKSIDSKDIISKSHVNSNSGLGGSSIELRNNILVNYSSSIPNFRDQSPSFTTYQNSTKMSPLKQKDQDERNINIILNKHIGRKNKKPSKYQSLKGSPNKNYSTSVYSSIRGTPAMRLQNRKANKAKKNEFQTNIADSEFSSPEKLKIITLDRKDLDNEKEWGLKDYSSISGLKYTDEEDKEFAQFEAQVITFSKEHPLSSARNQANQHHFHPIQQHIEKQDSEKETNRLFNPADEKIKDIKEANNEKEEGTLPSINIEETKTESQSDLPTITITLNELENMRKQKQQRTPNQTQFEKYSQIEENEGDGGEITGDDEEEDLEEAEILDCERSDESVENCERKEGNEEMKSDDELEREDSRCSLHSESESLNNRSNHFTQSASPDPIQGEEPIHNIPREHSQDDEEESKAKSQANINFEENKSTTTENLVTPGENLEFVGDLYQIDLTQEGLNSQSEFNTQQIPTSSNRYDQQFQDGLDEDMVLASTISPIHQNPHVHQSIPNSSPTFPTFLTTQDHDLIQINNQ